MKLGDRVFEAGPADETHGVVGTSILKMAQAVDRNDAPVLQATSHFGFVEEPGPALGIIGLRFLNPLERHVSIEFDVPCDPDLPEAASGVELDELKSRS